MRFNWRVAVLVFVGVGALIWFTPVGDTVTVLTAGLSPGDEGTLELRGIDTAYVADDQPTLRALLRAAHANDVEGVRALQFALKVTPIPLHTKVRVLNVDAIDHMAVAQVRLFPTLGGDPNDPYVKLAQSLYSPTGWVPAEWVARR